MVKGKSQCFAAKCKCNELAVYAVCVLERQGAAHCEYSDGLPWYFGSGNPMRIEKQTAHDDAQTVSSKMGGARFSQVDTTDDF